MLALTGRSSARHYPMRIAFAAAGLAFALSAMPASADQGREAAAAARLRAAPKVSWFDVSPPLREMARLAREQPREPEGVPAHELEPSLAAPTLEWPLAPHRPDAALQLATGIGSTPEPLLSFNTISGTGANPPSPSGDVGLSHYMLMSNLRMAVYDKSGAELLAPVNNNTIWAGFGGMCETTNPGQPTVMYDQFADRWFVSQSLAASPYGLCIAISTTGDPLGSYYRWAISTNGNYADAPKFATWTDAYYIGTREFTPAGPFAGVGTYALRRSHMLAGNPSPQIISFLVPPGTTAYEIGDGLLPADLDGWTPPPAGSPCYFLGTMDNGGPYGAPEDALTVWRFHADFAMPLNSTFTMVPRLPVSAFDTQYPCPGGTRRCLPQPGATTTQYLDVLSYRQRFLNRVVYRNFVTHESLLANQTVEAAPSMAGIRWYELRDPGGTPVVHQEGTYAPGTTDGIHRWCGSLAMDRAGNVALGYSITSFVDLPGVRYTGRLATDPLGSLPQGEAVLVNGGGIQTATNNRWGDYSSMNVDPSDDCTFWYVNEYYPFNSLSGWMLRVGTFQFPNCPSDVGVDDGELPVATRLSPIGVARGSVRVRFSLAGSVTRPVRIEVLDVTGRRVRRLVDQVLPGGPHEVVWDRTTETGEQLAAGVYRVVMWAGDERDSQGVVLLR